MKICALFGSFSKNKIKRLANLNSYRGQHSYSISYYDLEEKALFSTTRSIGKFPLEDVDIPKNHYCICHIQAPTTESKDTDAIHPAMIDGSYLWHNGIIKPEEIKRLQKLFKSKLNWDTGLLLKYLNMHGTPEGIDGSFSCLWINKEGEVLLFRNELCPLFYDESLTISSTRFEGSISTPPNKILSMNFDEGILVEEASFTTKDMPYFFISDLDKEEV